MNSRIWLHEDLRTYHDVVVAIFEGPCSSLPVDCSAMPFVILVGCGTSGFMWAAGRLTYVQILVNYYELLKSLCDSATQMDPLATECLLIVESTSIFYGIMKVNIMNYLFVPIYMVLAETDKSPRRGSCWLTGCWDLKARNLWRGMDCMMITHRKPAAAPVVCASEVLHGCCAFRWFSCVRLTLIGARARWYTSMCALAG